MTTNTNSARTTARFFASTTPNPDGLYVITDRDAKGTSAAVAYVKGRAAARTHAAVLTDVNPGPRALDTDDQATHDRIVARTSHAACEHASTKLARAICRREAAKARQTDTNA